MVRAEIDPLGAERGPLDLTVIRLRAAFPQDVPTPVPPRRRIPKGWPRDRRRRHHIGVYALNVAKEWRVGRATFHPAGWLRRNLERIVR